VTASRISPERMRKIRIFQEDAYISLDYQNQSGEIYRRIGKQIWRDRADIEHEEPLKLQLSRLSNVRARDASRAFPVLKRQRHWSWQSK